MSRDTASRQPGNHRPWSMIAGLIIVPISAWGAFALVPQRSAAEPPQSGSVVATTQPVASVDTGSSAADLTAACGAAGLELVAGEAAGSLTNVQQAGLDALREICDQEGLPLPGKPAPEPITETIVVTAPAGLTSSRSTQVSAEDDHGSDYDEHEDEHEEEHEDEGVED